MEDWMNEFDIEHYREFIHRDYSNPWWVNFGDRTLDIIEAQREEIAELNERVNLAGEHIAEQKRWIAQMQRAIILWGRGYGEEYERGLEDILYEIVEGEYGREQDGDYIHLVE